MRIPESPPVLNLSFDKNDPNEDKTSFNEAISLLPTNLGKDRNPEYLHWDKLRRKPLPDGINSHETWWYLKKFRRVSAYRSLPLTSKEDSKFVYWLPDTILENLHRIDQEASGTVELPADVTSTKSRDRYLVSSLIEESINSSQLEGASTTYRVAKKMLREKRQPRDNSERMIFNNYRAMSFVREISDEDLSLELLFELHRQVTDGTLEDPQSAGRFRKPGENVAIYDNRDNTLLHDPPHADTLNERMVSLCNFANGTDSSGEFLHPVVRSVLLHFMLGYDHPFVDGNGRTARALFYWSMAKHGYWLMAYISISSILKAAPAKYARSFLYTETDGNDTTYFIDYNSRVILRAIQRLRDYLAKKSQEIKIIDDALGYTILARKLNHRQIALLSHAIRNPRETYTLESHGNSHNVSYPTARSDLLELTKLKLLIKHTIGRTFVFEAVNNMHEVLADQKKTSY